MWCGWPVSEPLPFDVEMLQQQLLAERQQNAERLQARDQEIDRLTAIIKALQRHRFGRRAEPLDQDQLALALEDAEQAVSAAEAAAEKSPTGTDKPARRRKTNRGSLPLHLPREEVVLDVADKRCACCGGLKACIGEDVSQRLDVVPAQFKVIVTRRPKYACRACQGEVAQAAAPERLIENGLPTEALVAQVLVAKYADHLPLYRQAQIWARQGIEIDRSTLADWVGRAAFELAPVHARLLDTLRGSAKLFADETTVPVLDPGRGRTRTGQLWAYARDDRPWAGSDPPAVAYVYAPDRTYARPGQHLAGFAGVLQVAGYGAYRELASGCTVELAFCWAHVRRNFYELQAGDTPAPIASEALARIAGLYAVEADIRGQTAEQRRQVRQRRSTPILEALKPWLEHQLTLVSGKARIATAIRYALSRWQGLSRFLDDGRVELDSNVVERAIRPITLGRKNHLFAGSDGGAQHWAVLASLIATCKLVDVDPYAYLADVLAKLVARHPMSRIDELLPFAYVTPNGQQRAAA
jgi:transposase